jgi:hypothetical protein
MYHGLPPRPHAAALCAYYTVRHVSSAALVCERFVLGVMGTMYYYCIVALPTAALREPRLGDAPW